MPDRFRIEWAPVAERDLHEILEYIAMRDTADVAVAVYQKIMGKVENLHVHPTRCRIPPELKHSGYGNTGNSSSRRMVFSFELRDQPLEFWPCWTGAGTWKKSSFKEHCDCSAKPPCFTERHFELTIFRFLHARWTLSQSIRTIAELMVSVATLQVEEPPLYWYIAHKAHQLKQLGLSMVAIARHGWRENGSGRFRHRGRSLRAGNHRGPGAELSRRPHHGPTSLWRVSLFSAAVCREISTATHYRRIRI